MSSTLAGLPALPIIANRRRPGTASRRISTRLAPRSEAWLDRPVRLPPGRARLATRPVATGSPGSAKTIGMIVVACFAARIRLGPIRHNHIDLEPDELGCDLGGAFIATLRPAILDRDIPPLAPAQLTQPLQKGAGPLALCCSGARAKEPDGRQLRLLRARRQRPCHRAAEQGDERAASHSITSSAMLSSVGGTVRPSILAVWALMTNSNLVGCRTGRSVGLVPLRMRPA